MDLFAILSVKTLLMILIGGCMAALIIGVWLLIRPESFLRVNRFFSQWYSTRKAARPLMVPHWSERFVYRHHRPIGLIVLAGSAYVLYALVYRYDRQKIIAAFFGAVHPNSSAEWLVPGLAIALGVCALFALGVGGLLLIRPSLLKGFEAWANRWVTLRRATKFLDVMRLGPDRLVARYPRAVAGLIILGSLYVLVRLGAFVRYAT